MSTEHARTPWEACGREVEESVENAFAPMQIAECRGPIDEASANAAHIVRCVNAHDGLVTAAQAAIKYDEAIASCANNPERMASFCSAEGDDLDALYIAWVTAARAALAKVKP